MDTAELVEKTLNILNETLEAAGEEMDKLRAKNTKLREALEEIIKESADVDINNWPTKQQICQAIAQQALKEK